MWDKQLETCSRSDPSSIKVVRVDHQLEVLSEDRVVGECTLWLDSRNDSD